MKTDIHPNYYKDAVITCSCGQKYVAGSTTKELKIEVCSACHPFYTGKQDHLIDTTGRVDKFKAKMEQAKAFQAKNAPVVEKAEEEEVVATVEAPIQAEMDLDEPANEEPTEVAEEENKEEAA